MWHEFFFRYEKSGRTFGNFVVIAALTSPTVASGLTSIVKGKLRANAGGFAAADIVNDTILSKECSANVWPNELIETRERILPICGY